MARIDDGFSTTIEFSGATSGLTVFWEKTITPPGISGGGPNEATTMRNIAWRTFDPKKLKTLTPSTIVVAYDPDIYTEMTSLIIVNQSIAVTFPAGEILTFWGFIDEVAPNEVSEGEQPTMNITIVPTNKNDSDVEVAPVISNT